MTTQHTLAPSVFQHLARALGSRSPALHVIQREVAALTSAWRQWETCLRVAEERLGLRLESGRVAGSRACPHLPSESPDRAPAPDTKTATELVAQLAREMAGSTLLQALSTDLSPDSAPSYASSVADAHTPLAGRRLVRSAVRLGQIALVLRPSCHEEHVALVVEFPQGRIAPPVRTLNYLLLVLARQRLSDRAMGLGPGEEGWVYRDDLCGRLGMDQQHLNTNISRIRKQFARLDIEDSANIIERRLDSQEIRLGVGAVCVQPPDILLEQNSPRDCEPCMPQRLQD